MAATPSPRGGQDFGGSQNHTSSLKHPSPEGHVACQTPLSLGLNLQDLGEMFLVGVSFQGVPPHSLTPTPLPAPLSESPSLKILHTVCALLTRASPAHTLTPQRS